MASPSAMPAIPPPPGQTSNLIDPPNDFAQWAAVGTSLCIAVPTLTFALRCYVRVWIKRTWITEDILVSLSWAGLVTFFAMLEVIIGRGGGIHAWNLRANQVEDITYWFNSATIVYAIAICCAKVSILLLYRRVFSPRRYNRFDLFLLGFITLLLLFYVSTTLVKIFECTPRAHIWDKSVPGTCINVSSLINTSGLFNTITDVIILLIPIKGVWQLHITTKRKVLVVLIFTLGLLAPVFSAIGFAVRLELSTSDDSSHSDPDMCLWAGAEIAAGLVCVCLPELGALRLGSRSKQRSNQRGTHSSDLGTTDATASSRLRTSTLLPSHQQSSRKPPFDSHAAGVYLELDDTSAEVKGLTASSDEEEMRGIVSGYSANGSIRYSVRGFSDDTTGYPLQDYRVERSASRGPEALGTTDGAAFACVVAGGAGNRPVPPISSSVGESEVRPPSEAHIRKTVRIEWEAQDLAGS